LCKSYPPEFVSYFQYCRSLRFEDKPDYSYLKRLFRDLFIREGLHLLCFGYFFPKGLHSTVLCCDILLYQCFFFMPGIAFYLWLPSLVTVKFSRYWNLPWYFYKCFTLLTNGFAVSGYQFDYVFDWTALKHPQSSARSHSSTHERVSTHVCRFFYRVWLYILTFVSYWSLLQHRTGKPGMGAGPSAEKPERISGNPWLFSTVKNHITLLR